MRNLSEVSHGLQFTFTFKLLPCDFIQHFISPLVSWWVSCWSDGWCLIGFFSVFCITAITQLHGTHSATYLAFFLKQFEPPVFPSPLEGPGQPLSLSGPGPANLWVALLCLKVAPASPWEAKANLWRPSLAFRRPQSTYGGPIQCFRATTSLLESSTSLWEPLIGPTQPLIGPKGPGRLWWTSARHKEAQASHLQISEKCLTASGRL